MSKETIKENKQKADLEPVTVTAKISAKEYREILYLCRLKGLESSTFFERAIEFYYTVLNHWKFGDQIIIKQSPEGSEKISITIHIDNGGEDEQERPETN